MAHVPSYCPTARDIDCCPDHTHSTPCCDEPELHRPLDPTDDGGCLFGPAVARIVAAAARRSANPQPDDPDRLRARIEALRAA